MESFIYSSDHSFFKYDHSILKRGGWEREFQGFEGEREGGRKVHF
jgi:hypothetical protein